MQGNTQWILCWNQPNYVATWRETELASRMRGRPCAAGFHQSWMSFSVTNSRIAFQIRFRHFRHNRNTKSDSGRWSYRPVNCICTKKYTVHRGSCRFSAGVEASVTWHTGFSQWRPLFVDSRRQIAQSQDRRRMCEIRLTKLSCAAQQVGIVHFYVVTDIKRLSCPLWWMRECRNLLTSTHVGYRSVIRAVASGVSLKFGVHGASATNWLSRVNGARDNGIRLYSPETPNLSYSPETPNLGQIWRFLEPYDVEICGMTLQNNREPLLCYFKLCASFRSHWWIQTSITVRKRPIWVKFDDV